MVDRKNVERTPPLGWHLFFQLSNFELLICMVIWLDEKTLDMKFQQDRIIFRPRAMTLKFCMVKPTRKVEGTARIPQL